MARTRSRPSRSEPRPDPLDGFAHRVHHDAVGAGDGRIRVFERTGSAVREAEGLAAIPDPIPTDGSVWIDAGGPSPAQVAAITHALGLHPLIAEDILEGNQRAKIEVTDDLIHIVLFALEYGDPIVPSEIDVVLGAAVPAHGPRFGLGPRGRPTTSRPAASSSSCSAAPTTCCGRSATTSSTATSRSSTSSATRST